jgi:hypothetical protein
MSSDAHAISAIRVPVDRFYVDQVNHQRTDDATAAACHPDKRITRNRINHTVRMMLILPSRENAV